MTQQVSAAKPFVSFPLTDAAPASTKAVRCRFEDCTRKVPVVMRDIICKCGGVFCDVHRFFKEHHCTFDMKTAGREELRQRLYSSVDTRHSTPMPDHGSVH